jgi:hypothetical protein
MQWKELMVSNLSLALLTICVAVSDVVAVAVEVVVDLAQPINSTSAISKQKANIVNFDRLSILCLQKTNMIA